MSFSKISFSFPKLSASARVVILAFLFTSWNGWSQVNLTVNTTETIEAGNVREVNDLYLGSTAILNIEGTLIVRGNVTMANNSPEFKMGNNARVIVYGNFYASNKMQISVSSYLIIYGDFIKDGSSMQGDLTIDNGNIYIFGQVDPDWTDLQTCSTYDGTTANETSNCDYGKIDEYEKNFESLPEDLQQNLRCFPINNISNKSICAGSGTDFIVNSIPNVRYQWQVKTVNSSSWTNTGTNSNSLNIPPTTTVSMSGNQYRVVVKPTNATSTCKIAISNTATLTVNQNMTPIGPISGPAEVCSETGNLTFSLPETEGAQSYTWTFPIGWTIISGVNTNTINVQAGPGASSGTIQAQVTGKCDIQSVSLEVRINAIGEWTGDVDNNWNNPSNWSCNTLPTPETNVLIPANIVSGNYPEISSGANASSKNLIIESGASLSVTGNWLRIAGTLQNFGIFDAMTGSVSFQGTNPQSIPSATFENNRIENLFINNTSGVISEGPLEITGILKVITGNFNTGNDLTLISSVEKTALIDGSGMGEVVGRVTMQRHLDVAFGYKYFSTPVQNSTVGDFEPYMPLSAESTSFPHVYRYEENRTLNDTAFATGWEAYNQPDNKLIAGEGYAFNFGATTDEKLIELTGEVNNGTFSRNLENNNGEYTKGFHLVGNPYPSPIDWNWTDGWNKVNIENGIYFFTAGESQYTGTYTSYVNGISSADGKSSNIIPSMQGFFIKVSDPVDGVRKVNGNLTINNKARSTNFDQEFLKTREREERPLLRLTAAFEGARNKDAMVIYFSANSNIKFNKKMDAHKLMNTDEFVPNLYSLSPDKIKLSIKSLPFPVSGSYEKIPLGITTSKSGRMDINLADLQNIPENWYIYLIDKEKRTGQDLRKKSTYSFSIKEGEHNSRFQLMFSKERISDPAIAFDDQFSVDSRDFLKVKLNLEDGQKGELRVSTVTGQILEVKEGRGKEQVEFRSITSSGIYFINLYVNDQRYSKKVLVNN